MCITTLTLLSVHIFPECVSASQSRKVTRDSDKRTFCRSLVTEHGVHLQEDVCDSGHGQPLVQLLSLHGQRSAVPQVLSRSRVPAVQEG